MQRSILASFAAVSPPLFLESPYGILPSLLVVICDLKLEGLHLLDKLIQRIGDLGLCGKLTHDLAVCVTFEHDRLDQVLEHLQHHASSAVSRAFRCCTVA